MRKNDPPTPTISILFQNGSDSHFFNGSIPKANQIIRNTQITTLQHLNAIQPTVHKLSYSQAGRPSCKMTGFGSVPITNIWEELACDIGHTCEK